MGYKKYKFKTKPYEHQMKALETSFDKEYYALLMEMGTGKSKVLLDTVGILYDNHKIQGLLIIAPKSVYSVWARTEIPTHFPFLHTSDVIMWKNSATTKFKLEMKRLMSDNKKFKIFIMNIEALQQGGKAMEAAYKFLKKFKSLMVIDESSKIKNPNANRTKNIHILGELAPYRRILTGTPVTNNPLDVYSQLEFLNKNILGFSSFYSFRNRYCVFHESVQNGRIVKFPKFYTNLAELEQKVKKFSYRVTKDECLDLPEKVYLKRHCELTKEQKKVYDELKIQAMAIIEDESVSFTNKLTEILRLHQLCNGFVMSDDGNIIEYKNNEKLQNLKDIIEECQGKVIIWATYTYNIKMIEQFLKAEYGSESVVTFYGQDSNEKRIEARESFQNSKKVRFFVGNTQTGGMGLTLTNCNTMVYYNNNYSYELREQSEARIHRISQQNKCTYIDIVVKDTIDEKVIDILKNKLKLSAKILGEQAREWI